MQNLINYTASILNIKIDNPLIIEDMKQELQKVENLVEYREYIRENIKNIDLDYQTGFQKFIILTNKYLNEQEQMKLPNELAQNFSKQLTHKVEQARTFIKNQIELGNEKPFSSLVVDGHKFFTDKELKALLGLGRSSVIVELSEQHKLTDNLITLFLGKFIAKSKHASLTDNQTRVKHLLTDAMKG